MTTDDLLLFHAFFTAHALTESGDHGDDYLQYRAEHAALSAEALDIVRVKNHDYAGAGGDRPFRNFEKSAELGLGTLVQCIAIRISDKLQRLETYQQAGELKVPGEGLKDAVLDVINYCTLAAAWIIDMPCMAEDAEKCTRAVLAEAERLSEENYGSGVAYWQLMQIANCAVSLYVQLCPSQQ